MFKKCFFVFLVLQLMVYSASAQNRSGVIKVGRIRYNLLLDSSGFTIHSSAIKTAMRIKIPYYGFEIKDFDHDGHQDIYLGVPGSNTPAIYDILRYDPAKGVFRPIKAMNDFPDPKPIYKTGYYYSYHKNGCADECWESDLFCIRNNAAIRIGNIDRQLLDANKGFLNINRVTKSKRALYKTLPFDTESQYKGGKWTFIKQYWFKHYREFL